ncbi:hypothetical protein [Mesorhizobium sp. M8A.F.Ca.ET.021.01.1.1]|uniref:hypothetical protein n=1 Tax=Mesorhizobium sp. M8A.F.Ca.ET.021.01.1.1 TaxID=2496757 RepID=UPI000FCB6D21|nr:hypothetical protein [Mesorhizobium sp. M8A.F.Ca.ET.021.01.1.1]RUW56829.1 hypothetical protein EOA36_02195 [Mesorhizobium sp. M8A.F.Ca.ET.021.01.1.1]
MIKLNFEFQSYKGDDDGNIATTADIIFQPFASDSAAKNYAGRLAKRINGPVDIARAGAAPWDGRYLTTAAPSKVHAAGYRFERLT